MSCREEEMANEYKKLKNRLVILNVPLSIPKAEFGRSCGTRKDIKCFKCDKIGHITCEFLGSH